MMNGFVGDLGKAVFAVLDTLQEIARLVLGCL